MPAIEIFTDPLRPGRAQMPTFTVGDDTNWSLNFNDGQNPWNPGGVYVKIGYIGGLIDGTYDNAFWLTDRMNFRYIGSFVITSGVPANPTWDVAPQAVEGTNGAWLVRGDTSPWGQVKSIYVINPGINYSSAPLVTIADSGAGIQATASFNLVGSSPSAMITNGGYGYISAPSVLFEGVATTAMPTATTSIAAGRVSGITPSAGNGVTSLTGVKIGPPNGTMAKATATLSAGTLAVASLALVAGGDSYTSAPTVTISGGAGTGATATAAIAASSWGVKWASANTGTGYSTFPSWVVSGGGGSGAQIGGYVQDPADGVMRVDVAVFGSGYPLSATVSFTGGGGSGAAAYPLFSGSAITAIIVTNRGTGYTSAPTVVITASSGSGCVATAVLGTGNVYAQVTNPGSGYTSVPTATPSGGGGTGTTLTLALIGSPVASLTLTAGGSGFTSNPSVSFSGGGGTGAAATAALTGGGTGAGVVSVAVDQNGMGYTAPPRIEVVPNLGTTLAVAGIETNPVCFLSRQSPLSVVNAVRLTPWSRGRLNSSGAEIYDDAYLEIRPRLLVSPTFTIQGDQLTWIASFNPVVQFVQAVLNFRRTCVVDFEVFGDGRCLLQSKLGIQSAIQ